jgi:hypothetical protein
MPSDLDHFKELSSERWLAHHREHADLQKAIDLASEDINRRLNEMNQFRSQLESERGTYMTRDMYDREHTALGNRVKELEIERGNQAGKAAAYASAIGVIVVMIKVALHYWR